MRSCPNSLALKILGGETMAVKDTTRERAREGERPWLSPPPPAAHYSDARCQVSRHTRPSRRAEGKTTGPLGCLAQHCAGKHGSVRTYLESLGCHLSSHVGHLHKTVSSMAEPCLNLYPDTSCHSWHVVGTQGILLSAYRHYLWCKTQHFPKLLLLAIDSNGC